MKMTQTSLIFAKKYDPSINAQFFFKGSVLYSCHKVDRYIFCCQQIVYCLIFQDGSDDVLPIENLQRVRQVGSLFKPSGAIMCRNIL